MNKTGIFLTIIIVCALGIIVYGILLKDQILKGSSATKNGIRSAPQEKIENPAVSATKAEIVRLADLDSPAEVGVISSYSKEWPDGCLGLGKDELCTQATVLGYEITLLARGKNYTFRTNEDGSLLREVQ